MDSSDMSEQMKLLLDEVCEEDLIHDVVFIVRDPKIETKWSQYCNFQFPGWPPKVFCSSVHRQFKE